MKRTTLAAELSFEVRPHKFALARTRRRREISTREKMLRAIDMFNIPCPECIVIGDDA